MSVVEIEFATNDLPEVRRRLGDSGLVRRAQGDLLDQAARLGEHSAEMYAPERTRRLRREISSQPAHMTADGALEAVAGVTPVRSLAGGREGPLPEGEEMYPLYVHEGTGLFGRFARMITPRRRRAMVWFGRTGLVFAKSTRGQRARPYFREAYDDVLEFMPAAIDKMVRRILDGKL